MYRLNNSDYDERPWGSFERFTLNEPSTVKIISVLPHQELSLQYHKHRDEFWYVVAGDGFVTIGSERVVAQKGDSFFIPRGERHRLAGGEGVLTIMEIAFGVFDEEDIIRVEDIYGRI